MFLGTAASWINDKTIIAKYIRSLYFIHKPKRLKKLFLHGHEKINNLMIIKTRFYNSFWRKANSEQNEDIDQMELFDQGQEKVEAELCIFNILSTL